MDGRAGPDSQRPVPESPTTTLDWEAVVTAAPVPMAVCTLDGLVYRGNPAFFSVTGLDPAADVPRLPPHFLHGEDGDGHLLSVLPARGATPWTRTGSGLLRGAEGATEVVFSLTPLADPAPDSSWLLVLRAMVDDACVACKVHLSRDKYRRAFDEQTELVCRYLPDTTITFVNESYAAAMGQPPNALIGLRLLDLMPAPLRAPFRARLASLTATEPLVESSDTFELPAAEVRHIHWRRRALFDDAGELVSYQAVGRDISRQVAAEQAADAARADLTALLERLPQAVLSWDAGDHLQVHNHAAATVLRSHGLVPGPDLTFAQWLYALAHHPRQGPDTPDPEAWRAQRTAAHAAVRSGADAGREAEIALRDGRRLRLSEYGMPRQGVFTLLEDITARHAATQEAQRHALLYRAVLENVADPLFVHDLEGRIVDVNEEACTQLGYSHATLCAMSARDFVVDFREDTARSLWQQVMAHRRMVFDDHLRRADGSTFPVHVRMRAAEHGGTPLVVAICMDITPWKEAQDRLERTVEHLQQAENLARVGSWEWVPETGELFWSDNIYRFLDLEPGSVEPNFDYDLSRLLPEDREPQRLAVRKAVAEGGRFQRINRVRRRDGSVRYLRAEGKVVRDHSAVRVIGTSQDITDIKLREMALATSEARFSDFAQTASDWFWESDADMRLSYLSGRFRELFPLDANVIMGQRPWDLDADGPDKMPWTWVRQRVGAGQPFRNARFALRAPSGQEQWVAFHGKPVLDDDGIVIGYRGTATDVTAVVQAEQDLRAAKERAESASEAKSIFLQTMSHELRTPLNAVIGFGEMIAGQCLGGDLDARYAGYARNIVDSGNQLLELVNDILDMSRLETRAYTLSPEDIDVVALVDEAVHWIHGRAIESGVCLRREDLATPLHARVDGALLRQVLLHLLANAVRFTPEGGQVRVGGHRRDGALTLWVRDTGIGIPEHEQERVFEPFVQVAREQNHYHAGTGLGLPLCRRLVGLHGGTIRLDSQPHHGTTVTVAVPDGP